jgi:hypothetical protein
MSGLMFESFMRSYSGRPLLRKCTVPVASMRSGKGARSIWRPWVSTGGMAMMAERIVSRRDFCLGRYGALT